LHPPTFQCHRFTAPVAGSTTATIAGAYDQVVVEDAVVSPLLPAVAGACFIVTSADKFQAHAAGTRMEMKIKSGEVNERILICPSCFFLSLSHSLFPPPLSDLSHVFDTRHIWHRTNI
jgi:hypothetical protein